MADQIIDFDKVWHLLSDFVAATCAGRDDSHGHCHMKTVAETALDILNHEVLDPEQLVKMEISVAITAWLHDVYDKKYDLDGKLRISTRDFLKNLVPVDCDFVMKTIDLISYSTENTAIKNGQPIDFELELGEYYAAVRHIVSDADKLEAIGKIGIDRCKLYTAHAYYQKYQTDIPDDELQKEIQKHADEKLLRLKDEFIRTSWGKQLADPLHREMVGILKQ